MGMDQNEQSAILQSFRDGEFDVLVAASIAEEGLDIPQVDLVVFYKPIPSEIRYRQRRGRTGRKSSGRVIIPAAKDIISLDYHCLIITAESRSGRDCMINKNLKKWVN